MSSMPRVTHVEAKADYVLAVTFDDGTHGEISLADRLFGPMFEPLKDPHSLLKQKLMSSEPSAGPTKQTLPRMLSTAKSNLNKLEQYVAEVQDRTRHTL